MLSHLLLPLKSFFKKTSNAKTRLNFASHPVAIEAVEGDIGKGDHRNDKRDLNSEMIRNRSLKRRKDRSAENRPGGAEEEDGAVAHARILRGSIALALERIVRQRGPSPIFRSRS